MTDYRHIYYVSKLGIPFDQANVHLWLEADWGVADNGGYASAIADRSVKANNVAQPLFTKQPQIITNYQNGKPVLYFGGNDYIYRQTFAENIPQPLTVITIFSCPTAALNWVYAAWNYPGTSRFFSNNTPYINAGSGMAYAESMPMAMSTTVDIFNGANSKVYKNSILKVTGNSGSNGMTGINIGGYWGAVNPAAYNITAYWCATVIIAEAISDARRIIIENYFKTKYNLY